MAAAAALGGGLVRALLWSLTAALSIAPLPATTFQVIVGGLGGQPEYETRFVTLTNDMKKLVSGPDADVQAFSGDSATKINLKNALATVAAKAKPEDALVVTLIGHGNFDGVDYKFNVKGPDVTARDLRDWLASVKAKQLVVIATSSAGAALPVLQAPHRVLISATRTGTERNAVVFSRYFVEAFRDAAADTDKNESVTALEAFRYADQRTAKFYEAQKRLSTEHALLEDTGQGQGVRAPGPENGKGMEASRFVVMRFGSVQKVMADPAKQALLARKEQLEQAIDKLKYEKAALPADQYKRQLQQLLLELARVQAQIDQ